MTLPFCSDYDIIITVNNNGDATTKLINVVCADGSTEIDTELKYRVSDKDLFAGSSIVSGLKWNDGTSVDFEIFIGEFKTVDGVKQVEITVDYN